MTGLLVSREWADGRRLVLTDWGRRELIERTPETTRRTPVNNTQLPGLLAERFGLHGFRVGADGGLGRAAGDGD